MDLELFQGVCSMITDGDFSDDQMAQINELVVRQMRLNRSIDSAHNMLHLRIGGRAVTKNLRGGHNGRTVTIVEKKQTKCVVMYDGDPRKWSVPASCLEAVA